LNERLVKHIGEAHGMEQSVLRLLDGMISTTDDPELVNALEHHRLQTERHVDLMEECLQAHGESPSTVRQMGGVLGVLAKLPLDLMPGEKAGRSARDAYATEHFEIASYELLSRIAEKAGDQATATIARQIIEEEREMADVIAASWDRLVLSEGFAFAQIGERRLRRPTPTG
jgi:ferritin-like metal-binding protein YciE